MTDSNRGVSMLKECRLCVPPRTISRPGSTADDITQYVPVPVLCNINDDTNAGASCPTLCGQFLTCYTCPVLSAQAH